MKLSHSFTVDAPQDRVWAFLNDVPTMASCIPGVSDLAQIDETTFDATVTARIGPISARFGCRISVLELDEAAGIGTVEVAGKDVKIGGGVKARMVMSLTRSESGTIVAIASDVEIMGKIGQYGHGMISKRAESMLTDFAACVQAQLA